MTLRRKKEKLNYLTQQKIISHKHDYVSQNYGNQKSDVIMKLGESG